MLVVSDKIQIPDHEFTWSFARSSGSGGQNVNKVNSKAILRWNLMDSPSLPIEVKNRFIETFSARLTAAGEVVLQSDRFRDQPQNIQDCLKRLLEMIKQVERPPKLRRATKPTRASKRRRLDGKTKHKEKKQNRRKSSHGFD